MYIYDFLIFVGCLVLHIQCQTICKPNQYTVVSSNGSFVKCFKCATCHHGRGLYPPCGSRIPDPPDPDCRDCPAGEFSDELDSAACHSCQRCAEHEIVTAPCTSQSNTICSGTCEAGYFYSKKDSTHSCMKCSYCCLDGRDEEIPECPNQGLEASKQHCHPRPDKDCSPGLPLASPTDHLGGTEASENNGLSSSTIAGIAVGVAGGVILALAGGIYMYLHRTRKRKEARLHMNHQSSPQNYAINGPVAEFAAQSNNPSCTQSNNAAGSQEGHHAGTVEGENFNGAISGVLYTANEQENQNATHGSLPSRNHLSEPDAAFINWVAAKDNTSDRKSGGDPTALPDIIEADPPADKKPALKDEAAVGDLKDNTSGGPIRKLRRQFSGDSQKSGDADAECGRWKRSPSTTSFTETLKTLRKMSLKKEDSLVDNEEQDTDVSQEAIAIKKQPSSQKIKEGSKVELVFRCKAPGNSKLSYQWYKDDVELPGKDDGTLVLKPVTLLDFGSYKCVASRKDSPGVSVESSLAELHVAPREGTTYKCLGDIDFDTENRIGMLLTQTSTVVAGWKEIASKYGMNKLQIKSLENDPERGKRTLEYILSRNPNLTVYDFCKTLKEHNIRRLDIVDALRGHLSVSSSSDVYV